ncbi:hypothetical protein ACP275_09G131100 [Erythranthe tilingii]
MGSSSYQKITILAIFFFVVVLGVATTTANGQMVCKMTLGDFLACKSAATPPNPPPPSTACCSGISHADLSCLCSFKNNTLLPSFGIDPNLALQLPKKCKIPLPSQC